MQVLTVGVFSFFSGAGFLDLGFEKTENFEVMFVNENHHPFLYCYQWARQLMSFREPKYGHHLEDVASFLNGRARDRFTEIVADARLEKDVIAFIGGPPCPDFSIGGKNKGSIHISQAKFKK